MTTPKRKKHFKLVTWKCTCGTINEQYKIPEDRPGYIVVCGRCGYFHRVDKLNILNKREADK